MSKLLKVKLAYFRSYGAEQEVTFSIPNGKSGSGLTVIVGANNSGKTTLLEAFLLKSSKRIANHERVSDKEPYVEFHLEDASIQRLTTAQPRSAQLVGSTPEIEIVPSRRTWASKDGTNGRANSLIRQSSDHNIRNSSGFSVAGVLKDIEKDAQKRDEFTQKLQTIFPTFSQWYVGYDGENDFIGYETKQGVQHRTDFLGDGIGSLFRILSHLMYGTLTSPLIIDEPELSLQPEAQKKLLEVIAEFAKDRQIIISTHSTYFINLENYNNGATYIRINKHGDKESIIYQLGEFSKYEKLFKGDNWQMPFIFDEVAKEIFFQDNILFLEGQHDVGLLRKYFFEKKINPPYNLFGYGVRGFQNFEFALTLAKDLGLEKVACVIDNGADEDLVFNKLKSAFMRKTPKYLVIQTSKNDIRDKEECGGCNKRACLICRNHRVRKIGYFDSSGVLKDHEKKEFNKILIKLDKYFKSK